MGRFPFYHTVSGTSGHKTHRMTKNEALRLLRGGEAGIAKWNKRIRIPVFNKRLLEFVEKYPIPDLTDINLSGADLRGVDFSRVAMRGANFFGANLEDTDLSGAKLANANLSQAILNRANLTGTDLCGANLSGASFESANLINTLCKSAVFDSANLSGATFNSAALHGASFNKATFSYTMIARTALHVATGLEQVIHSTSSSIGLDSIEMSNGTIPDCFLRGCGVSDTFVTYQRSLVNNVIEFYSCFISYSTEDEDFAKRLHNDFQAAGIRCWKWDHDARTGRSLWSEIDETIRVYEKLVLIISEASLRSPAVNREIERALNQEDKRYNDSELDSDVLFPVRLDDYVFDGWRHERKSDVTRKVIADAVGWETDHHKYTAVITRLVRDLTKNREKCD